MNTYNNTPDEETIAAIAHQLWEDEGRPEGKAEEHWQRAEALLRQAENAEEPASLQPA